MRILIAGGRVIDPANKRDAVLNLLIEDGRIAEVASPGAQPAPAADRVLDARGKIPHLTLFFCSIFILNALAQEKLPEIVKKIEPSTVVILTYGKEGKFVGQGSGFFISQSGDIITHKHVLPGVHRAEVKTAKGKVYPITFIVAEDKEADIIRASVNIPLESVRPLSVQHLYS